MIFDLLFPHECLHCRGENLPTNRLLCDSCEGVLDHLHPSLRCLKCYSIHIGRCQKSSPYIDGRASIFTYRGPIKSLIHHYRKKGGQVLAKQWAAWAFAHLSLLPWPPIDLIVPVPRSFARSLFLPPNPSFLIAKELGLWINCPVVSVVKQSFGIIPQEGRPQESRSSLKSETFYYHSSHSIADKTLLIVDDYSITGGTINEMGKTLQSGTPSKIFALTIAKS